MNRFYHIILILGLSLTFSSKIVFAESAYVLPYPSAMPGNIFYKLNLIQEEFLKYWYFGDFGRYHYNLKQSDKYLVEAKTLFDYKQYLLGYKALKKSDSYFKKILPAIQSASLHKKNVSDKLQILKEAESKHVEELKNMKSLLPESFMWMPEKENPQKLMLREAINISILIRHAK